MNVTNVSYTYEVAYISRPNNAECSGDLTTLPDGYTVYPVNTSSNNIEVFGLIPGTCYAFGVRVYTSISDSPGGFTVRQRATASDGISCIKINDLFHNEASDFLMYLSSCLLIVLSTVPSPRDTATSSSVGLVGGAAGGGTVAVVIVLLIVIVIVIILR